MMSRKAGNPFIGKARYTQRGTLAGDYREMELYADYPKNISADERMFPPLRRAKKYFADLLHVCTIGIHSSRWLPRCW
jgi:hypothetical protein